MNKAINSDDILRQISQFLKPNLVEIQGNRDYKKEYDELIRNARNEELFGGREKVPFEYKYESHHIVPRCMGGSDEPYNLINLTIGEHFDAHFLLTKMYRHEGLDFAYKMMHGGRSKTYQEARNAFINRRHLEY